MAQEKISIKKEITISATRAHLIGLIFLVPLFFLLAMPYYLIWSEQFTSAQIIGYIQAKEAWTFYDYGIIILVILIGIIAHEFLHGLGWSYFTRNGWKSIKFGVMWEMITPYCHCEEPLKMKPYRFGTLLPAVVLGFIPSVFALVFGSLPLMLFGFFFTFAAGGDFIMLWLLRKEPADTIIADHPDKIGCVIYDTEKPIG